MKFTQSDFDSIVESETTFSQDDLKELIDQVSQEPVPATQYTIETSDDDDEQLLWNASMLGKTPEETLLIALRMGLEAMNVMHGLY